MNKDIINSWLERNDEAMQKAAEWLSSGPIETFICYQKYLKGDSMLRNATDLEACDEHDIETFFSLLDEKYKLSWNYDSTYGELDAHPYSIREWNKREKGYGGVRSIFTEWCNENYQEVLPEELLTAVRERHDVACIVNANAYGGGGYEVLQDLFLAAKVKVAETIKRELKQ